MAPENGWLEYDRFLLGPGLFSGASVGGRNPKQPPGMYKNLVNNGINYQPQLVSGSRISGQPINVVFWKLSWRIHPLKPCGNNRPGGPTKAGDQPSGIQSFLGDQMDGITTGMDGIQDGSSSPHRFVEVVKEVAGWEFFPFNAPNTKMVYMFEE